MEHRTKTSSRFRPAPRSYMGKALHKCSERRPPRRDAETWAAAFMTAIDDPAVPAALVHRIAATDIRLRERIPAHAAHIVRSSAAAAGVGVAEWVRMATRGGGLLTVSADKIAELRKELEALTGDAGWGRVVKTRPELLSFAPGKLSRYMKEQPKAVGVTAALWRTWVIRWPALLAHAPATLTTRIDAQRDVLQLSAPAYHKLLGREPLLLTVSAERFAVLLATLGASWGVPPDVLRQLVVKSPKLLRSGSPQRMDDNVTMLAKGLGVERSDVIRAVLSFPALAYQAPARIVADAHRVADAIGVARAEFIDAVLRVPSLMVRRRQMWRGKLRLIRRIARALGEELRAVDVLRRFPTAMTYGTGRLMQRYVIAKLGFWSYNWQNLLTLSDRRARARLEAHFAAHPEHTAIRAGLQKRGLL